VPLQSRRLERQDKSPFFGQRAKAHIRVYIIWMLALKVTVIFMAIDVSQQDLWKLKSRFGRHWKILQH
jgi:hypothetical protein